MAMRREVQRRDPVPQIIEQVPRFIREDNYELLVKNAQELGKHLSDIDMTTSQIRNIFGEVRRIEMQWERDAAGAIKRLLMLRPKLAYQAGRFEKIAPLQEVLDKCIEEVGGDKSRFRRFVDFFEAVIAYHRFYGGE